MKVLVVNTATQHYLASVSYSRYGARNCGPLARLGRASPAPVVAQCAAGCFHAHVGGMDIFVRVLITADDVFQKSDYKQII
jgi:hypothetical protein